MGTEQNLIRIESALKENYLPAFVNMLGVEPSAVLSKIKKVPLDSQKFVGVAPVGLSGGFGFSGEGLETPEAGYVEHQKFFAEAKDMYVNVEISAKAVRLTGTAGSMVNALDTEIKAAYETAKWNMGRALFGNGTGILTTIQALSPAGNTIKVNDTSFVKEGLIIDVYEKNGDIPVAKGIRIKAVDRINNTITVSGAARTYNEGFITVQKSYKKEITGIGAIFDDNIDTIWGVSKKDNPFIKPIVTSADGVISDGIITKTLRMAERDKGSNVNMLLCGDTAYDEYVDYLRTNNIRVENMTKEITGGFKAISFAFGNREVEIVNEGFVPANEMWGVDTDALEMHQQEWEFEQLKGGGIFNLMEGKSVYRALLSNYGELICKKPGGCVRITNVA